MTRKDYVLIAKSIAPRLAYWRKELNTSAERGAVIELVEGLTMALQADNARFDSAKFLKACGIYRV